MSGSLLIVGRGRMGRLVQALASDGVDAVLRRQLILGSTETAGLVSSRREANRIYYRVEPEPLAEALGDFLSAVCPTQIVHRMKNKRRN